MTYQNKDLTVEEICEKAKLSRSTLYQYVRMRLLHPPVKIAPKKLRYNSSHLKRLKEIKVLREKKIPLPEIKKKLPPPISNNPDGQPAQDDLRLQIIKRSAELTSKKGFAHITISDITEALNIGKGTFYLYFKSKEELFLESVKRLPEIVLPSFQRKTPNNVEEYAEITMERGLKMLETFNTFSGISSFAKFVLCGNDEKLIQKAMAAIKTMCKPLEKEMQLGIEKNFLKDIDKEFHAYLLYELGEATGYWLKMHPEYDMEEAIASCVNIFLNGIKK